MYLKPNLVLWKVELKFFLAFLGNLFSKLNLNPQLKIEFFLAFNGGHLVLRQTTAEYMYSTLEGRQKGDIQNCEP